MQLLTNAGNGAGQAFELKQGKNREISHLYTIFARGTFDSGTLTIEISADEPNISPTNWLAIPSIALLAPGVINAEFRANWVRAVVAGGVSPAITVKML